MTEHKLPRPHVAKTGSGWRIDFGNGAHGTVVAAQKKGFRWAMQTGTSASGWARHADHAFLALWCRAAALSLPPPVVLDDCEIVHRAGEPDTISPDAVECLAVEARTAPVVETAKLFRRILRQRTGFEWSVRVGSGRAANTITIRSARSRMVVEEGASEPGQKSPPKMSPHDIALLAALTGRDVVTPRFGVTVINTMRQRREMVHALAGVPERVAPVLALVVDR